MALDFHRKLIRLILDILFPIRCINCGLYGQSHLCPKCMDLLCIYNVRVTDIPYLDTLISILQYKDPLVAKAIKMAKYKSLPDLAENMAIKIYHAINPEFFRGSILVPIPLFKDKEKRRGFNQAELLANHLGKILNIEVSLCLVRARDTKPQSEIENPTDRFSNISEAFYVLDPTSIYKERVILVDDVSTSGSTLSECARILKESGVKKVDAVVFARG